MTKAYSIFLTGLFSLFIGGILVGSLLLPDRTFSPWRTAIWPSRPSSLGKM